jgi:hypothetical protein
VNYLAGTRATVSAAPSTSPGGANGAIQYNNNGLFGGYALGNSLVPTAGVLDTVQDIRSAASPQFMGLSLTPASAGVALYSAVNGYAFNNYLAASASATDQQIFNIRRSRGTIASPTGVAASDTIGSFLFQAHNGTSFTNAAIIQATTEATGTGLSGVPSSLRFTLYDSAGTGFDALTLKSNKHVLIPWNLGVGNTNPGAKVQIDSDYDQLRVVSTSNSNTYDGAIINFQNDAGKRFDFQVGSSSSNTRVGANNFGIYDYTNAAARLVINQSGNVYIGKTSGVSRFGISGLPTSASGLASGDIWNDSGTLKIV